MTAVSPAVRERRSARAIDRADLEEALRGVLAGEVRFGAGDRALYATDASNYRHPPIGVVVPRSVDDVVRTLAVARRFGAPIVMRGGGTSLAGQGCNTALLIDCSKYVNRVVAIDPEARRARVEPGTVLDDLRNAAAKHGLTFGPDPATHDHCTLGGMIGNDSCGVHSVMAEFYGPGPRTEHSVEALDVVTWRGERMTVGPTPPAELERIIAAGGARGEIYAKLRALAERYAGLIRSRFPNIQRRVSGYNLPALLPENGFNVARALTGSEGTCVTILGATLTLIPEPKARALLVLGYPTVYHAADDVPRLREFKPIGLEGMDDRLTDHVQAKRIHPEDLDMLPEGGGWLMVEFGGDTPQEALARANEAADATRKLPKPPNVEVLQKESDQGKLWHIRESGLGATAFVPGEPDTWEGWEDSAVAPERVGTYLREFRALLDRYQYRTALYGHFGQGCVHCRITFDLHTQAGIEKYRNFTREAAELVVSLGGSLSGEHGDGQSRGELLPLMFGEELVGAFREFKAIWDPDWKMNPGRIVDARPRTADLRVGPSYHPAEPETHFKFPADGGSFARATLRCVGVGACRRSTGGTMCPSYQALKEEKHTTRGRAHLLFEMLRGDVIGDVWKNEDVKESLDLCLSCKGCKSDCPVNVDMATYKAEFLSHYWEGKRRPRHAYAFGLIDRWARLAALAPGVVNFVTRTPGLRGIAKAIAGMAPERTVPKFSPRTFREWFARRPRSEVKNGRRVILWTDTFNDHFHPRTLAAAVDVLEAAGCDVEITQQRLCCGRPLYDYGMLDEAKRRLVGIIDALRPEIEAGVPIVGLEPSCVAVFRDELGNLLPDHPLSAPLKQCFRTLPEYLKVIDYTPPRLEGKAMRHGHCHHKAIMHTDVDDALLSAVGLDWKDSGAGCCGMAGSFGFEAGKYELSRQVGEHTLLPAVRAAPAGTLLIADGFSCREQIVQETGRQPLHTAEVLQLAIRGRPADSDPVREVRKLAPGYLSSRRPHALPLALAAGAVAVIGGILTFRRVRRRSRR